MNYFRLIIFCCSFLSMLSVAQSQDPGLANQYFNDGEYEKAASLFEQILERDERNEYYFNRYVESLIQLEQYERCEKAIKKQIKKMPENTSIYVTYGGLFERLGKDAEANAQYQKAIEKMAPDFGAVSRMANSFATASKLDFAILAYEQGGKMISEPTRFAYNLGEIYRRKGDVPKMLKYYLDAIGQDPQKLPSIQTILARFLDPADFPELQSQLYTRVQEDENPDFIELLAWSFIQRKDFKGALRQYKALDARLGENGQRIFNLANDAADNRDYDSAIAAYEYIVTEKGPMNPFFYDSKQDLMECRRKKITEGYTYTTEDLKILEVDYENFLSQFGKNKSTATIIMQLADLEAYYMNNTPKAIMLLDELKAMPGLDREKLARTKISLADIYLMGSDIWESTLLYSQVDKDFKEEQIGQEARFKNARLSYFNGDFQWAQAQFDILKASTSKLISNDALDLSVFIMDNLNLDTNAAAISLYSSAEMLVFQNRFDDAFLKLDTLTRNFPDHSLRDDILYLEAQIFEKRRKYEEAAVRYAEIAEKYPEDIRADNALYALAQLYETRLNDLEKAKTLYEKIFIDYSGSVYAVDARKRYRILRGDKMQ